MKKKKRVIFHVDVNSAYLSWEAVYRLHHLGGHTDLREQVSAVGGDAALRHGIILANRFRQSGMVSGPANDRGSAEKVPGSDPCLAQLRAV